MYAYTLYYCICKIKCDYNCENRTGVSMEEVNRVPRGTCNNAVKHVDMVC